MPDNSPYIRRIYDFMNKAYGANGTVKSDKFHLSYDDFSSKISSDSAYADKIFKGMSSAYGPKGTAKPNAFTATIQDFRGKIGIKNTGNIVNPAPTNNIKEPDVAQRMLDSAIDVPQTLYADEKGNLTNKKTPGLMQDISAFNPLIEKEQQKHDQELQRSYDMLTATPQINPVTGKQEPQNQVQLSIQAKMKDIDEIENRLKASQKEADEFYKTTGGGLYYSFVKPVYESLLSVGKNVGAGVLRLSGDLGQSFGMDDSKKVLDKTADKLVDYFDFNRLAREGNSYSFLNMTPTAQQGKISKANILPKAVGAISQMASLMGGASILGGTNTSLFTSSFLTTYEDYRSKAKNAGLSNEEADNFALTSAGVTSALEMISPNKYLFSGEGNSLAKNTVFNAIKSGVPVKQAIKEGIKSIGKEITKENIQEFSQNLGDKIIEAGHDLLTGKKNFNSNGLPSFEENLETFVLTTIATGAMAGSHLSHATNPSNIERSAYVQAASNIDKFNTQVQTAIQEGNIEPQVGRRMMERVGEFKELNDALIEHGRDPEKASAIAVEALKSKKIQERVKPLGGIKPLSHIVEESEAEQNQIGKKINDIESDIPPVGTELTKDETTQYLNKAGASEKVIKLSDNGYKSQEIDLKELYNNNEDFRKYVDDGKIRPSGDKSGLNNPVIINSDGKIVDGMNRLAQQYIDGEERSLGLIEMQNNETESPRQSESTLKEENIQLPKTENNAVQIESPGEMDVRQQTGNGEEVGQGNTEPENIAQQGEIPTIKEEKVIPEHEQGRAKAIAELKSAWNEFINKPREHEQASLLPFDLPDPIRDSKVYKALVNYFKEEIKYRVNQVKGFSNKGKGIIKGDLIKILKEEGLPADQFEYVNNAFEEAFQDAKKTPGVLSDKKDRVSIQKYIKDIIKSKMSSLKEGIKQGKKIGREEGREKGIKEGIKTGIKEGKIESKQQVKLVQKAINETLKNTGTRLNINQLKRIQSVLNDAVTSKNMDKTIERAINIATNMVYEQKNKVDIARAGKLIKSLNKLKRSKSMVQQDIEWIKQLQMPSPSKVDDIKTFNEMLVDFLKSRKGDSFNPKYTKEEIADFISDENNRIHNEKMQGLQEDLDALINKGELPDDVTLDDYIALLDNKTPNKLSEGVSPKNEILKKEIKARVNNIGNMIQLYDYDQREKSIMEKLNDIDVSNLSHNDLIRFNNVLNNIEEFGTLDGAGDIITTDAAIKAANSLAQSGNKIRQLPSAEIISRKNISNIMSSIFYNDNALSDLRSKVLSPIENTASKVYIKGQQAAEELSNIYKRYRLGPAENARLHAISYINQFEGIEPGEIENNIRRKIDELIDDAQYFISEGNRKKNGKAETREGLERLKALQSLGIIEFSVENNDGKNDVKVTINDKLELNKNIDRYLHDKLSLKEYFAYDFVTKKYSQIANELEFITRTYANKEFKFQRNYVSLVPKKKNGESYNDKELSADTDLTRFNKSVNKKPSGTTISRVDAKPANTYYDGDFFSNFVNRYYQSLYTMEVLPSLQVVAKTVNNEKFKQYINGQLDEGYKGEAGHNYNVFVNKLAQVVNEGKYSPFFKPTTKTPIERISKTVIASGIRLALNNIWQGPAQYAPAILHNYAINDHKAVSYAVGSAFRAMNPTNKQFAQDRAEFLKMFTGVKRVALGSEAYQKYIKNITYTPAWWVSITNVRESIAKASAYSLEKGDHAAQNAAYIAGYITSLIKQGKINSVSEFDFAKETANPNAQALSYAEQQASSINNESDKTYRPDVIKDGRNAKYLWLLQGFALNAYQNAMSKFKIITDNRTSSEERSEAMGHFLGYLGEIAAYQGVKHVARGFQVALAGVLISSIWGLKTDEDEEQKKNRHQKDYIRTAGNILADISLSGTPAPVQTVFKTIANMGYKEWAKVQRAKKKEIAEEEGESFDPRGTYLSPFYEPYYGVDGPIGSAEFYSGAAQKAIEYMSEEIAAAQKGSDEEPQDKSETKLQAEKAAKQIDITTKAINLFLQSGDLWMMGNRMQQRLKNVKDTEEE